MKARKLLSLVLACSMVLSLVGLGASAGKINPDPKEDGVNVIYTVVKGDNLWKIAARNGVELPKLLSMNPQIKDPGMIYIGDKVVVGRRTTGPVAPTEPGKPADPAKPETKTADLVLKNGHIQTMVNEQAVAQAVAVKGNTIVYVGDDAGAAAYVGADTNVIDLKGQFVSPSFMDGHLHAPGAWMSRLYEINLEGLTTKEEYLEAARAFVQANPDAPSYSGGTFMLNAYMKSDGSNPGPQKEDLDAICADKPMAIFDTSFHSVWVNSKTLELAGITKDTPNPSGGIIAKNAAGEPTGFLTDAAMDLAMASFPSVEYTEEMWVAAIDAFQKEANSRGLTAITDPIDPALGGIYQVGYYHEMEKAGNLTVRFRPAYTIDAGADPAEVIEIVNKLKAESSEMVRPGVVKIFSDGVTESATAVMLEPYLPEAGQGEGWYGAPIWVQSEFEAMVAALDKAGIQVHIHAIGDGAVRSSLDAYENAQAVNGVRDSRHTITHVCAIAPEDIQRMADLKVVSALQFLWMYADPLYELEAAFIGTERAQAMYPVKNMWDAGCIIAGASDAPVTDYTVLDEIEVGVTRNSPFPGEEDTDMYRWSDQGLTAYQMLEAYTKNVAYENFMDDELGTIEVGKKADLVVLDQNILTCAPKAISDTEVVYTIANGRIVYSSAAEKAADIVFQNGTIQTMVDESSVAQAVAIKGDEIVYVGTDAGVASYVGEKTQVIDLKGQFMSPGFMDGHLHVPGMWLDRLYNISLEGMKTNEEYLAAIKKFVDANPDMEVYSGRPFMLNAYQKADGSNPGPSKADLDAISKDKPIIIKDVSGHNVWANSKALEIAGVTKDTKDPDGGRIYRDAKGEPTGCLADNAMKLVTDKIVVETTDEMYTEAIKAFMKEANAMGVTGVANFTRGGANINKIYNGLDTAGELTLRMRIATTFNTNNTSAEIMGIIKDGQQYNSDMMNTGIVKIFYDGVTESGTAVMLDPYTAAAGKGDNWRGEPIWKDEDFFRMVKEFDAAGIQVHIHAIGDGAVSKSLDAIEAARKANGVRDSRFTITHVCAISERDVKRMADLGVVSALQFLWMYADPLYELEAAYVGTERAQAFYPTKNMWDAGCIISGASDAPVTPYDVLDEIEVGVTRNSPYAGEDTTDMHRWADQALTPYQMLEAYTKNVAYQNFMDDMIGTIEVGKKADLVVLGQNILKCDPKTISDTQVVYTVSDGRIVYSGK